MALTNKEDDILVPFWDLSPLAIERLREYKTTLGVTTQICTMGVHLTSVVARVEVKESLVDEASHLNIVWSLDKLNTLKGILRNKTSPAARLCAPGNHLALVVSHS